MTSVEKRRSSRSRRKNGRHRKYSDGGFSDTSSGGSFLDETDREVSSLTDRAFRSLCIGDEAVYNDSDLGPSSPCIQRDRQLAFVQSGLEREDGGREELKRAAHDSFSMMVQQYGQDWIHEGMYGVQMNRNPQWDVYEDSTQGRLSATFQNSFMEMSQQERFFRGDHLGCFSNGVSDLSLQHRRSRSRVSSLIRAFNSEDGAVMDGQLREWNDEASWTRPALINMPTTYQQNFTNGHFPLTGQFSSHDVNLYPSEAAAVSHMNTASSFMASSHSQHSMMTQVDCNTNFFIHSEFSPFRVWRDRNRFPFQQGEVSGFMRCSEFPKWGQKPKHKELSMEPQMNGSSMFQERSRRNHRTMITPIVPNNPSTSNRLHKASALEKRCESDLAVHYPQRMRTHSLGNNRPPPKRPSTASPATEMSCHVNDTISSVKDIQQQIKIMTGTETAVDKQGALCNDNFTPFGYNAVTMEQNVPTCNNLLSPELPVSQAEPSETSQYAGSPQLVEHAPVRAESRGATPDVRMSSYKSKASLLFNLKDNRKRVKSTYSPSKFKSFETVEKSKDMPLQQSKDTVIDIPEDRQPDGHECSWTDVTSHQCVKPYYSPRLLPGGTNSQPTTGHISDYNPAQSQDEKVQNYPSNQLTNGQNLTEVQPSFTSCRQDADVLKQPDQDYSTNKDLNEAHVRQSAEVAGYQLTESKQDHNVSKERWITSDTAITEQFTLKAAAVPWKQDQHAQANIQAIAIKEGICSPKHKGESQQSINKDIKRQQLHAPQVNADKVCAAMLKDNQQPTKSNTQNSSSSVHEVASSHPKVNQVKDDQFTAIKTEQNMTTQIKSEQSPVQMPKVECWTRMETPKDKSAEPARSAKTEVTMTAKVNPEHHEANEQGRWKETDGTTEENTKALTTQFRNEKEETNDVKEQAEHREREVKEKQTDIEELKGIHVKNEQLIIESTQRSQKDGFKLAQDEAKPVRSEQEGEKKMEEQVREEKIKTEAKQINTYKAKLKHGGTKTDEQNVEDVKEKKAKAEEFQPKAEIHEAREANSVARKVEQVKMEQISMDLAKVALAKQQNIKERLTKPTNLTTTQHVKSEPNKVERVKTELAKARAELAKIKEKMKGEHKEKVRSTITTKEETTKEQVTIKQSKEQPQTQTHQQKESPSKADHWDDYYESLREKYGFTNSVSLGRNKVASNDANVTSDLSLDNVNVDNSKSKHDNPAIIDGTKKQVKEEVKPSESLYVYSETSKEFKLLPTCAEKTVTDDTGSEKGMDVKVEKLKTSDVKCHAQQTHSERKHKSEGGAVSSKGLHVTAIKASPHKEKTQTKQEILTSKIKAHAEKEISAIMEVFKQIPASQNLHGKQRPPLHEVSRGNGSTMPSNITSKHQMGRTLGDQLVKACPIFDRTSGKTLNPLQKDVPIDPMKSSDSVPEAPAVTNKVAGFVSTDGGLIEEQKQAGQPETQNKEQESKKSKDQLLGKPAEKSEKAEDVICKPALNSDELMEESSQSTSKQKEVHKDFVLGQSETCVAKSSPQIMGIVVTERKNDKRSNADADKSCVEMSMKNEFLLDMCKENEKETHSTETQIKISMNMHDGNVTEKMTSPLQQWSNISAGSQSKIEVKEGLTGKDATPTLTFSSINKVTTETELLHSKQDITAAETAGCTLKTSKEDSAKNHLTYQEEIHTGVINVQLKQTAAKVINSEINYVQDSDKVLVQSQSLKPPLEEDVAPFINPFKCSEVGDKSAPLERKEKSNDMANSSNENLNRQASPKPNETHTGEINQMEDVHIDNIAISVVPGGSEIGSVVKHPNTTCSNVATTDEHQQEALSKPDESMSKSIKDDQDKYPASKGCDEHLKDKLEDKLTVQDVLSSVRKLADSLKNKNMKSHSINRTAYNGEADRAHMTNDTTVNIPPNEGDYFQVQGIPEVNTSYRSNSTNVGDTLSVSKVMEHPDQLTSQSKSEPSTFSIQTRGVADKNPSKQSDCPSELQNSGKTKDGNETKQHSEVQYSLSAKERHSTRNSQPTREEPQVKSKPQNRVSTIPEISALADYARLKVIVSEDRENTNQEFPPHKKEGFFPLIKSRHSRRPVFTSDPQEHFAKEKTLPKKTDSAKVNKEPKTVVFPITEREHQRTGMFKLGDRERLEKNSLDLKDHKGILQKQVQVLSKMTQQTQVQKETDGKEVPKSGRQQNLHFTQATPSSSINKPRETPKSLKLLDSTNPKEKNTLETADIEDRRSNISQVEKVVDKITIDGTSSKKSQKERLEAYYEEAEAKVEQESRRREYKTAEDTGVMIEERMAFISDERRCPQRDVEGWEKLNETAQRMEEERKAKEMEGSIANPTDNEGTIEKKRENRAETQEDKGGSVVVGERNRLSQEERTAQEEEQIRAVFKEEQRLAKRIQERRRAEESRIKQIQEREMEAQQRGERQVTGEQVRCEDKQGASAQPKEEQLPRAESAPQEVSRDDETRAKRKEEHSTALMEKVSKPEEQKRAALMMDALQYYTIASTDKKLKERRVRSPVPIKQKNHPPGASEDTGSHRGSHRPPAAASPAPSLPRSNTSSPSLGAKPLMFRVKDNTTKGSSFTKSVKPRFHKNFGEDSRVDSPMEWRAERREDEKEIMRRNTGTPIHLDTVTELNRLAPINESSIALPASSSKEYSAPLPHHKPFSRRSIALDEDDSHSVISNMSEDVGSFSTSAADLADLRGLYDYERPVSACSFSSDVSRSGKPPTVPPKSDKALRRAKRLTTRRIRKELTQDAPAIPEEKPQQRTSSRPSSASAELQ
ncbi:uncharacterized protein LOC129194115 isoform X2 [Dunckerocampus dactyliophorus]|uniref:uncharacterized protein LOC129194115 isoform X2 n=1 Tax=Dunckerocampus dactyliophorus TaxID=161453 RepID=UPI002405DEAD|nr:uncharacterized protein LOC129194115 isoform X2 [Dunckerocampus dactyliophorus]